MQNENKALRYARLNVWLTAALLAVLCAAAVMIVPRAVRALDRAEATLSRIDALTENVGASLDAANNAADTAGRLAADNADAVAEALEKFNSVDFATLNKAIGDLSDIVEPLARVSNLFNR